MEIKQPSLKLNIVYQNTVSYILQTIQLINPIIKRYTIPTVSQNSLCVTSKLAQITVERENGCLGLTLRGGGEFPLIVTNVRPHGPVFKVGRIKPGDRLLRVDNVTFKCFNKQIPY